MGKQIMMFGAEIQLNSLNRKEFPQWRNSLIIRKENPMKN